MDFKAEITDYVPFSKYLACGVVKRYCKKCLLAEMKVKYLAENCLCLRVCAWIGMFVCFYNIFRKINVAKCDWSSEMSSPSFSRN